MSRKDGQLLDDGGQEGTVNHQRPFVSDLGKNKQVEKRRYGERPSR